VLRLSDQRRAEKLIVIVVKRYERSGFAIGALYLKSYVTPSKDANAGATIAASSPVQYQAHAVLTGRIVIVRLNWQRDKDRRDSICLAAKT